MRRAFLAITGLAAGTTALVALKGAPDATQAAPDRPVAAAPVVPGGPAGAAATPGTAAASAAPRGSARPSPSASASRSAGARVGTRPKPTTAAPKPTSAAPRPATRTVTGPKVTYQYGSLQVRITLRGDRIVDATAVGLPVGGQSGLRSDDVQARYSGTSGEVVATQSADLSTVSGATYTSDAYRESLQAAIDRA